MIFDVEIIPLSGPVTVDNGYRGVAEVSSSFILWQRSNTTTRSIHQGTYNYKGTYTKAGKSIKPRMRGINMTGPLCKSGGTAR